MGTTYEWINPREWHDVKPGYVVLQDRGDDTMEAFEITDVWRVRTWQEDVSVSGFVVGDDSDVHRFVTTRDMVFAPLGAGFARETEV